MAVPCKVSCAGAPGAFPVFVSLSKLPARCGRCPPRVCRAFWCGWGEATGAGSPHDRRAGEFPAGRVWKPVPHARPWGAGADAAGAPVEGPPAAGGAPPTRPGPGCLPAPDPRPGVFPER